MNFEFGITNTLLLVEPKGYEGVRRIAGKVAQDIAAVTGQMPEIGDTLRWDAQVVLCATVGHSPLVDRLMEDGQLDSSIIGKREVYQIRYCELGSQTILVIAGSDKRGTIYGMFALSEYIGVSPLYWWGDAEPEQRESVTIGEDIEIVSKEPSVKYRGFFINDEWPCFGNWAERQFGGPNANCYDKIFEFLLRMKGNYLWPAMWRASFPLDGPGGANEELADLYGVIMGYSHHEPCLRASEEWDKVRGPKSVYGNEWNYYTNEKGLLRYWEDALKRSGGYENIITIGMRGERDTSMLGEDSTLAENIDLLKRIITRQRQLIAQHVPRAATQMLALYKEVERYFHGDAQTEGLRTWKELDDVLFMLCEDNFGHLRTVPPAELREHPGGWGMYYHFDYHGGPISYEWVDSTPMAQAWEQMTQAWEYGIRDLWIVNVGDIKFHEVPLSYYMALAYDFDRWGTANPQSSREYTALWAKQNFPAAPDQQEAIGAVLRDYIAMNALRRPEALHAGIYHPAHYNETEKMLALAENIEERTNAIYAALPEAMRPGYYSMVHFPALASANLVKMHLYAGKNAHYAQQGKSYANRFIQQTEHCIRRDLRLAEEFAAFHWGKWRGMEQASHIGFTRWNDDDARYPVLQKVTPMPRPSMKVSRADREAVATKVYGNPMVIEVPDFKNADVDTVHLEIANNGASTLHFTITGKVPAWLKVSLMSGTVSDQIPLILQCDRAKLPKNAQSCTLQISDGQGIVNVVVTGQANSLAALPQGTYISRDEVIVMPADGYSAKVDAEAAYVTIPDYGKYGTGMKVLPSTAAFTPEEEKPSLTYSFRIDKAGEYTVEILTAPNNPIHIGTPVNLLVQGQVLELIPADFRAGESSCPDWAAGVLNQIHTASITLFFDKGIRTLTISPLSPGVVLERIRIYPAEKTLLPSYLGPDVTPCKPFE